MSAGLAALGPVDRDRVAAVVATAGTTNVGVVDDLSGIGEAAGAFGGGSTSTPPTAARRSPSPPPARCSTASSMPTASWSTPTSGSSPRSTAPRSLYREPSIARATHTQHAEYLDVVTDRPDWNPSDYAYHLSRRARGLPFWFSLATHGTDAYAAAIEHSLRLAEDAADLIRDGRPSRAGARARPVDRGLPPPGLGAARTTTAGATARSTRAWPSWCRPRGEAKRCCASAS